MSLSDIARASGFGRGFPGDVLAGKRRLTTKSAYAFEQALRLPAAGRKLFRLLVARDEADVFPELDRGRINAGIEELRSKPWSAPRRKVLESESRAIRSVFRDHRAIHVYAAAGRPDRGATLEEIRVRTRLSVEDLRIVLDALERGALLKFNEAEQRYVPQDLHLFVPSGERDELFLRLFRQACVEASERVLPGLMSASEFFFSSTFTVGEKRLPELKQALKDTILRFIDDSIDADGERLTNLTVAFHAPSRMS